MITAKQARDVAEAHNSSSVSELLDVIEATARRGLLDVIEATARRGAMKCRLEVFPSKLPDLVAALAGLGYSWVEERQRDRAYIWVTVSW